jgi:hypothetical protein
MSLLPMLGKALLGKGLEAAFGGGSSPKRQSVIQAPSFAGAYVSGSRLSSVAGKVEGDFGDLDLEQLPYETTLAMWNKRLFGGDNSYTQITLPTLEI